jgi:hypothetical protein
MLQIFGRFSGLAKFHLQRKARVFLAAKNIQLVNKKLKKLVHIILVLNYKVDVSIF